MSVAANRLIDALLFDMDGVIVDTEYKDHAIQVEFVREVNRRTGYAPPAQDYSALVGKSYAGLRRELCALTGERVPPDKLWKDFLDFDASRRRDIDYASLFRKEMVGLLDFAERHGIRTAVVSSATMGHIEEILDACGIRERFDLLCSGAELPQSKPHPEVYQNALEELGVSPDRCLAVEDSPSGIEAAHAAGIRVIGYRETRLPVDQSSAEWLVADMDEALGIVSMLS